MLTYSSPEHIGVSAVLHRLLVPRHPPCALSNLTFVFQSTTHCVLLEIRFIEHSHCSDAVSMLIKKVLHKGINVHSSRLILVYYLYNVILSSFQRTSLNFRYYAS